MLRYMQPSSTHWRHLWLYCLALCASAGFWAGSAAAQTDDGGWFDGSAPRATERGDRESGPAREPDYSPPPPNFQERPEAPPPATEDIVEDDPEAHRKAVEEFSPRLAPYGSWVNDSRYGRIWVPSRSIVGTDFVPYSSGGHWALTPDDEWIWVSDYPFGGVTFHYGRWVWTTGSYWGWVPGYVYAPAWVDFHVGAAGYIGWAPLAPRRVWRSGVFVSVGLWGPPPVVFCPTRYVFVRSMPRYIVRDRVRVRSMAAQTRVYRSPRYLSGGYLARGPSPSELRIPRSALPERRVEHRRVIAEPQLTSRSRSGGRVQLADRARPSRGGPSYLDNGRRFEGRSREATPGSQLPSRSRSYQTAPRSYADGSRGYADGSRGYDAGRGHDANRSYSDGGRRRLDSGRAGYSRQDSLRERPAERRTEPRGQPPAMQRGSMWGTDRREPSRSAAPRALPQREAPGVIPRERHQRSPYGYDGAQRGAARSGAPAAAQRAPRPAPDTRSNGRRQRRDNSGSEDSRHRGR